MNLPVKRGRRSGCINISLMSPPKTGPPTCGEKAESLAPAGGKKPDLPVCDKTSRTIWPPFGRKPIL